MKNKFTMWALAFVAGAIVGAAIVWITCCCCCKMSCSHKQGGLMPIGGGDNPTSQVITPAKANTYFKAYLTNFQSIDTLKGFSINMEQFNAMQLILNADTSVHGFRIYMGMDSLTPVRMVCGFGSPDHTDDIYVTTDVNSGPCPHICDDTSPIIQP